MNQVQLFTSGVFGSVRAVVIDGKAWFVANDVATSLGYAKPNNAINTHCQSTLKQGIPHPQSPDKIIEVNIINEYDVIRLIMKSKLPQAQEFEKWVIEEVIPSVLKTGSYSINKREPQVPQLSQEESLALSILRANDMGERALAIQEYGSYKHKEGMLHGVIEVSNGRQVTLRQVGGYINEAMGEDFDKIGYIQSDTVVATDFRRFLAKQGHYTMQRFPKKGQEGEYEMKRHYQPTDLFRTSIVEQGMGYIKNIDDERGKLEGFFYDTITDLVNREEFQKAFLKFLKVKYTYMTPLK